MIKRTLETKLKQLWAQFPIITLTGPRQSGKTTLVKSAFDSLGTVLGWRYAAESLKS